MNIFQIDDIVITAGEAFFAWQSHDSLFDRVKKPVEFGKWHNVNLEC